MCLCAPLFLWLAESAINRFAEAYPHDYSKPEQIVILHRSRLRQAEVPVKMIARQHGDSLIAPLRWVYFMMKVILATLINSLRNPHLENWF